MLKSPPFSLTDFSGALRLLLRTLFEQLARTLEDAFEPLLLLQHGLEEVALTLDAAEHVPDMEVRGLDLLPLDLLPFERRRDGRARLRPHRVRRDDRLAARVLHVIDVDHPHPALALRTLHGRHLR